MPRTYSSIEKIRAELAWMNETPDPNKCGCRHLRCCEETVHKRGECSRPVTTKFRTFRWESYCQQCREYEWCGSKSRGYMVLMSGHIASGPHEGDNPPDYCPT